jgi:hypothetical protein
MPKKTRLLRPFSATDITHRSSPFNRVCTARIAVGA